MPVKKNKPYTCSDYRKEMILLGLKHRLNHKELTGMEREQLISEIQKLELELNMD